MNSHCPCVLQHSHCPLSIVGHDFGYLEQNWFDRFLANLGHCPCDFDYDRYGLVDLDHDFFDLDYDFCDLDYDFFDCDFDCFDLDCGFVVPDHNFLDVDYDFLCDDRGFYYAHGDSKLMYWSYRVAV